MLKAVTANEVEIKMPDAAIVAVKKNGKMYKAFIDQGRHKRSSPIGKRKGMQPAIR